MDASELDARNNQAKASLEQARANLDSRSGMEIISIFQELNRQGKTILLITHDQNLAEHAGRIVRINAGRIVGDMTVAQPKNAADELAKLPVETSGN